ncbi:MAG: DMT family transporter [Ignavibacteria bacterium]
MNKPKKKVLAKHRKKRKKAKEKLKALRLEKYLWFFWLGILVIPLNQFFFMKGISYSSASHSGVIYSCTPLFAYLIAVIRKNEVFIWKKLLIISLTIIGIIIIFYENLKTTVLVNQDVIKGDVLLVFAVLSWAMYLSFSKEMVERYGALVTSTVAFSIGNILYLPIFFTDVRNFDPLRITATGVLGFLHLTVLVAFGSYFIFSYSTKIIPVSTLTTFLNSSPIITVFFSYLLLKESLTPLFLVGAVVTISGVYLSQLFFRNEGRKEQIIIIE